MERFEAWSWTQAKHRSIHFLRNSFNPFLETTFALKVYDIEGFDVLL
jgi:hypothetical protein